MAYSESHQDLLKSIERLDLPAILVGGAVLDLHDIRFSQTIDLVVAPELMLELLDKVDNKREIAYSLGHLGTMTQVVAVGKGRERANERQYRESVKFMSAPNDHLYQVSFDELYNEAIDMNGVLVSPLSRILDWKLNVGKAKDLTDIALIKNHTLANIEPSQPVRQLIAS